MDSYHPKRKKNEIVEISEIDAIIKNEKYLTIALVKEEIPYIVTLSYGYDYENRCFYFHCANKGDKLDFIRSNPNACASLIEDNGYLMGRCEHDYKSLIIRGKIDIIDSIIEKKYAFHIILKHLEENPEPIIERSVKDDNSYNAITILKLNVSSIIGKKYLG